MAISNHRLRALENGRVSFEWKDYAHHGQRKIMALNAVEFMRRFLLHVLPCGLVASASSAFWPTASALETCNCAAICSLFTKLLRQPISTTLRIPPFKIARPVRSASSGG
jgi:hypothetical protein